MALGRAAERGRLEGTQCAPHAHVAASVDLVIFIEERRVQAAAEGLNASVRAAIVGPAAVDTIAVGTTAEARRGASQLLRAVNKRELSHEGVLRGGFARKDHHLAHKYLGCLALRGSNLQRAGQLGLPGTPP